MVTAKTCHDFATREIPLYSWAQEIIGPPGGKLKVKEEEEKDLPFLFLSFLSFFPFTGLTTSVSKSADN